MWVAWDLSVSTIKLCLDFSESILKTRLETGIVMMVSTSSGVHLYKNYYEQGFASEFLCLFSLF